jgi:hypothetical protein
MGGVDGCATSQALAVIDDLTKNLGSLTFEQTLRVHPPLVLIMGSFVGPRFDIENTYASRVLNSQ